MTAIKSSDYQLPEWPCRSQARPCKGSAQPLQNVSKGVFRRFSYWNGHAEAQHNRAGNV